MVTQEGAARLPFARPHAEGEIGQNAGRAPLWGVTPESGSGTQRSVQPWGETVERFGRPTFRQRAQQSPPPRFGR